MSRIVIVELTKTTIIIPVPAGGMSGQKSDLAEILAVGDLYLDRKYPKSALVEAQSEFEKADLRIGNLESPLSQKGELKRQYPWASLRTTPDMVNGLTSFDILGFANNHAMDYGPVALSETLDILEENNIKYAGAGKNIEEAKKVTTHETKDIRIGVLAFEATKLSWQSMHAGPDQPGMMLLSVSPFYPEPHVSEYDVERMHTIIKDASSEVDILCVLLHYGVSVDHTVTVHQRALSKKAIDAGADTVIGSHPHTLQAVDVYQGAPIFYSLGNFVFDSIFNRNSGSYVFQLSRDTAIARLSVNKTGISEARIRPAVIETNGVTSLPESGSKAHSRVANLLIELSEYEDTQLELEEKYLRVPL